MVIDTISTVLQSYADQIFLVGGMVLNVFAGMALLDSDTTFPRWQATGYALVLGVMAITYLSMQFPLSALSFGAGMVIWLLIATYRSA